MCIYIYIHICVGGGHFFTFWRQGSDANVQEQRLDATFWPFPSPRIARGSMFRACTHVFPSCPSFPSCVYIYLYICMYVCMCIYISFPSFPSCPSFPSHLSLPFWVTKSVSSFAFRHGISGICNQQEDVSRASIRWERSTIRSSMMVNDG